MSDVLEQEPQAVALTVVQRAAVALGADKHEQELTALSKKYTDIVEIKNNAGREQCHAAAMVLSKAITNTDKTGKEAREDANAFQKAVIVEVKRRIAIIESERDRLIALRDAWDAEREREKQVKLAAEQTRIAAIRAKIDAMRNKPASMVGRPSAEIGVAADHLSETVIDLEEYADLAGEAQVERNHAIKVLREMQAAQLAHEAEQARLAEERAQLERERAKAAERERKAETARREQERKDREAREAEDALVDGIWKNARRIESNTAPYIRKAIGIFESMAKDWENDTRQRVSGAIASAREEMQMKLRNAEEAAEREAREAELRQQREAEDARLRAQREAEEARLAEQRAEIARQQAELQRQQEAADNLARINRETQERQEQERKLEAAHAEALIENARIDADRTEQQRLQAEADARAQQELEQAEEQARRDAVDFATNGPGDLEIVVTLAEQFGVDADDVVGWIAKFDHSTISEKLKEAV